MLCLSGFELYSRWVPLIHLRSKLGIIYGRRSFAVHFGDHLRPGDHLGNCTELICRVILGSLSNEDGDGDENGKKEQ